jgi:hypothetical protein
VNLSKGDHPLYEDMGAVNELIRSGKILNTVSKIMKLE